MELKTLVVALGVTMWLSTATYAAEEPAQPSEEPAAPVKCLKAVVNAVTGHAICVSPKGAKVEPPPPSAKVRKRTVWYSIRGSWVSEALSQARSTISDLVASASGVVATPSIYWL